MKVIYVGHFAERSGFSIAAENYVRALVSAGVEVACRNIRLAPTRHESSPFIAELEKKSLGGATVIIQHVLPHHMSYAEGLKNVGLFVYDIDDPSYCEWTRYADCLDEIWVPNEENVGMFSVPTYCVPHTFDTTTYSKDYAPLDIAEIQGSCVFYLIAELGKRKNIRDAVVAFHSEFHSNLPVNLVIKTSKFGLSPEECANVVTNDLGTIKNELKLYPSVADYKPEILITHGLTDNQIGSIHKSGFCYVNSSRGEAWNMPQFDSWAYGNHIIYYTNGKMYNYLKSAKTSFDRVHPVVCQTEPCYGYSETFQNLGTSREEWMSSNITGLMKNMRHAYEAWLVNPNKLKHADYEDFSYESVGAKMKGLLSE